MKKVFLLCQFGTPHPWSEPFFDHFLHLEAYGWYMKVFTPNGWPSRGNIEFIPMTVQQYDALMGEEIGVTANNTLVNGVPSKLISDHYVAWGAIFQRYIRDFDFWGILNWDVVVGRLDHFIPDSLLETCDVWADDVNAINGVFTLFRNDPKINNLFRYVPDWQHSFTVHQPMAFDECQMTRTMRKLAADGIVRFKYPPYFALGSYDRLIQHRPVPNLYFEKDGALIERYEDHVCFPNEKGCFGREILLWHFSSTKQWPKFNPPKS